jgi:hypothetical protein
MRQKTKDRVERLVDELGKYEMNEERVACRIEVLNLTVEASPRAVCAVIDSLVENYFYSLFYIASHVLFCISLNLVYKFSLQYKVSEVSRLFSISAT